MSELESVVSPGLDLLPLKTRGGTVRAVLVPPLVPRLGVIELVGRKVWLARLEGLDKTFGFVRAFVTGSTGRADERGCAVSKFNLFEAGVFEGNRDGDREYFRILDSVVLPLRGKAEAKLWLSLSGWQRGVQPVVVNVEEVWVVSFDLLVAGNSGVSESLVAASVIFDRAAVLSLSPVSLSPVSLMPGLNGSLPGFAPGAELVDVELLDGDAA